MKLIFAACAVLLSISANATDVQPLLISQHIPEGELKNSKGKVVQLKAIVEKKPTIIVFYRGGWCPYCNRHLMELQEIDSEVAKLGFQIVAISPDTPKNVGQSKKNGNFSYTLYSDSTMAVAKAFGIAFEVDAAMMKKLASYNIDIEAASGQKHHLLPVPSIFMVNREGIITFSHVNPDYTNRLDKDVILAAARAVIKPK